MKPKIARAVLCVLSPLYLLFYLFVLFVALVTSGGDLVRSPGAWYGAIAPLLYVSVVGAYAVRLTAWRMPLAVGVALHVLVLPALAFSFLGLGILLPVFAALWWTMAREHVAARA